MWEYEGFNSEKACFVQNHTSWFWKALHLNWFVIFVIFILPFKYCEGFVDERKKNLHHNRLLVSFLNGKEVVAILISTFRFSSLKKELVQYPLYYALVSVKNTNLIHATCI